MSMIRSVLVFMMLSCGQSVKSAARPSHQSFLLALSATLLAVSLTADLAFPIVCCAFPLTS